MISIPVSLFFAKLMMMSSAPEKSAGDARYATQDPFIHRLIQSRIQFVLGVRSFYVERRTWLMALYATGNKWFEPVRKWYGSDNFIN